MSANEAARGKTKAEQRIVRAKACLDEASRILNDAIALVDDAWDELFEAGESEAEE